MKPSPSLEWETRICTGCATPEAAGPVCCPERKPVTISDLVAAYERDRVRSQLAPPPVERQTLEVTAAGKRARFTIVSEAPGVRCRIDSIDGVEIVFSDPTENGCAKCGGGPQWGHRFDCPDCPA